MWQTFSIRNNLSIQQLQQFKHFYELLIHYNSLINLTALDDLEQIIAYHFDDSLALGSCIDLTQPLTLVDIGTGGGFPGIPLKIRYPHIRVILIEVTEKKVMYLRDVIDKLGLTDIQVVSLDWRTFLRKSDYEVDVFCARASLQPEELIRVFQSGCRYRGARLVYWASAHWQASKHVEPFMIKVCSYSVLNKARKLVLLADKNFHIQGKIDE